MNRGLYVCVSVMLVLLLIMSLCVDPLEEGVEQEELKVYVGSCMMGALTEIARDFEEDHPGVNVTLVAKSNVDLMDILYEFREGDVFIPDDGRVADEAVEAGFMDSYEVVATSHLAIFVQEGNPLGIQSLEDLTRDDIRIVIGREDNAMGQALYELLGESEVLHGIKDNYVCLEESRCGALPTAILNGDADAAITCSPSGLRKEGLDIIDVPGLVDTKFMVTVGVLEFSDNRETAREFAVRVVSEYGKDTLARYGYDPL